MCAGSQEKACRVVATRLLGPCRCWSPAEYFWLAGVLRATPLQSASLCCNEGEKSYSKARAFRPLQSRFPELMWGVASGQKALSFFSEFAREWEEECIYLVSV